MSLRDLVDTHQAPLMVHESGMAFVDQKNPQFEERQTERAYILIAELLGKSPSEVEERFYAVQMAVMKYHNRRIETEGEKGRHDK